MAKNPGEEADTMPAKDITSSQHQSANTGSQNPNEVTATPSTSNYLVDGEADEDRGIVINASDIHEGLLPAKKKRKKKSKPASKRGLDKPTGFEEFHADGPLTPEQFAESKEAFRHRILKAIQRFERTRKLSNERRDVFYKYLIYGGVDVGPNMFMGGQSTEDMDKDELNTAMAQANISEAAKHTILDPKGEDGQEKVDPATETSKLHSSEHMAKYVVDFEATMRGFLSRHAPIIYAFDSADHVKLVTTTLERFMDYLLQHDVCPEYSKEVLATRDLCRSAQKELWDCADAQRHLPGDFNIACSTLFGGSYAENYDGETYWGPIDSDSKVFVGIKPEQATQIIGFAVAGAASEDVYIKYLNITTGRSPAGGFETVKTIEDHRFVVTRIEPPSRECIRLYKENTAEFRPVGRVHAKFFPNPDAPPEDLTPAERAAAGTHGPNYLATKHEDEFVFFIESEPLLSLLRPGMRIEATIHELNCGIWFFDEVVRVLPSFDLWLENELTLGWKEPRPVAGAPLLKFNPGAVMAPTESTSTSNHGDADPVTRVEGNEHTLPAATVPAEDGDHITTAPPTQKHPSEYDDEHPY